jgi:hypothetical protein
MEDHLVIKVKEALRLISYYIALFSLLSEDLRFMFNSKN